jgi:hypothetical protein
MAAYEKVDNFVLDLGNGVHNFGTHAVDIALTSDGTPATDVNLSTLTQTVGSGYTAGGQNVGETWGEVGGVATLGVTGGPFVWNAADTWTAFRYVYCYNSTVANGPLIARWDYGSALVLNNGDSFTVAFTGNKVFDLS